MVVAIKSWYKYGEWYENGENKDGLMDVGYKGMFSSVSVRLSVI